MRNSHTAKPAPLPWDTFPACRRVDDAAKNTQALAGRHGRAAFGAAAILLCTILAGCYGSASSDTSNGVTAARAPGRSAPVTVTVATVESRAVQRRIATVGSLYGFERVTITPKVEGRVAAIHYDVADRVPPGATLLEIDPTDFALAVDEAERALDQELSKLGASTPPQQDFGIEQLPSVERARLILENAQNRYERQKKLVAQNAVSREVFEQTENDLHVADAALRQARFDAKTTVATVRQRQAVLASARRRLADTEVSAPRLPALPLVGESPCQFVVARRMASVGEMVRAFPSTPIFELVIDDVLKLRTLVPERYQAQVSTGLAVEVRVEAYPDRVFPAHIGRVNPTVDPNSRTFEVEAFVPNSGHLLRHGGFAKADVIVEETAQALTVPLEAITNFAGISKVFRIRDDASEEVIITVGGRGRGWVEATGDLQPGDAVATSGQSRLANGTKVVVRHELARAVKSE